jgi:type I restriction enzyme S subunit
VVSPPLNEQKQIAEILTSIDQEIKEETTRKEQIELLKKGLMQVLLTGKIRVKT